MTDANQFPDTVTVQNLAKTDREKFPENVSFVRSSTQKSFPSNVSIIAQPKQVIVSDAQPVAEPIHNADLNPELLKLEQGEAPESEHSLAASAAVNDAKAARKAAQDAEDAADALHLAADEAAKKARDAVAAAKVASTPISVGATITKALGSLLGNGQKPDTDSGQ